MKGSESCGQSASVSRSVPSATTLNGGSFGDMVKLTLLYPESRSFIRSLNHTDYSHPHVDIDQIDTHTWNTTYFHNHSLRLFRRGFFKLQLSAFFFGFKGYQFTFHCLMLLTVWLSDQTSTKSKLIMQNHTSSLYKLHALR